MHLLLFTLTKYIDWLKKYAPPQAVGMTFSEAGPVPSQGQVAQQIFWYTAFTKASLKKGLPVVNKDGTPKWRMAPSPHGPYWEEGMKLGYQDAGSWTMLKSTPLKRRKAAWLYAQFSVSKTVSLTKFIKGLTPIRESDLNSPVVTKMGPSLGPVGVLPFSRQGPLDSNRYQCPRLPKARPVVVAKYFLGPLMVKTPQEALGSFAHQMDRILGRLERMGMKRCALKWQKTRRVKNIGWHNQARPRPRSLEKPKGQTVAYSKLLREWSLKRPRKWRGRRGLKSKTLKEGSIEMKKRTGLLILYFLLF